MFFSDSLKKSLCLVFFSSSFCKYNSFNQLPNSKMAVTYMY